MVYIHYRAGENEPRLPAVRDWKPCDAGMTDSQESL